MFFISLLRWLRGYVRFVIKGAAPERLLNLCARNGIQIWKCKRKGSGFEAYTSLSGYRQIRPLVRKTGVVTRAKDRHGLPFLIGRHRKRAGVLIGGVLFVAFMLVSQQFVWVIHIEGCESLPVEQVQSVLEELGVRRGTLKSTIDPKEIQIQMLIELPDISWTALNVRGTTATLIVRERTAPPPKIDLKAPANVVAAQDGQIITLEVTDGKAVLKEGSTVLKGEIIVSGVNEDRWGLTHLVRANARVIAHVPETLTVEIPLQQEVAVLKGEVIKRRYLDVAGIDIPLFIYSGIEGDYKLERMKEDVTLFGFTLPLAISKETYVLYDREVHTVSPEYALHLAEQSLAQQEKQWETIIKKDVVAKVENGVMKLTGHYVVEVDIAQQVEIPIFSHRQEEKPKKVREGGY